jgi:hypothetical protein
VTPPDEEPQQPAQYDPHHPSGYPGDLEADVVLRDGATAHLRPITPADAELLVSFYAGCPSSRSTTGSSPVTHN